MPLNNLFSVDIVAKKKDDTNKLIIVAGLGWPKASESLQFVQFIIKLAGVVSYGESINQEGDKYVIELISYGEPPYNVLTYARSKDVSVVVSINDKHKEPKGRKERIPNLSNIEPDINALQKNNTQIFQDTYGVDLFDFSVESLKNVDKILEERRKEEGLDLEEADEELEDGDLIVLAGAYAGEVVKKQIGGIWVIGTESYVGVVHFKTKSNAIVNLIGKARKYLHYGSGDSLFGFVQVVISHYG